MDLNKVLEQLGLQNKENEVYLALLELGLASVSEIAIKANIKRTTTYDVLSSLIKRGLVSQSSRGKKRLFIAEPPEKLKGWIDRRQKRLEDIMPILKSLYNVSGVKPKIRYYEGIIGLKKVYTDTIDYQGELLAFVSAEDIKSRLGTDFTEWYIHKRKEANISVRAIAPLNEQNIKYKERDKKFLKQTLLVPEDKFPFNMEMNIYGNKVAFMSFKEEMGIIIESNDISNNLRSLFELSWLGAKELN